MRWMKIRFGVSLGADTAPDRLASIVDHLETSGVDSLWFSELVYAPAAGGRYGVCAGPHDPVEGGYVGGDIAGASSGPGGQTIGVAGGCRT